MTIEDMSRGIIEIDMAIDSPPEPIPLKIQLEELQQKYDNQNARLLDLQQEKSRLFEKYFKLLDEKNRLEVFLKNKGMYEECETYWIEKEREAEEQRHHQLELERETELKEREHQEELSRYCATSDSNLEQQKASIEKIRAMMRASRGTLN